MAHCFPDDMHYALSFGYLFPVVTAAFHFFCFNVHVCVVSVFHLHSSFFVLY